MNPTDFVSAVTISAGQIPVDPVVVGRITAVHGIKGWVKVYSFTEHAENIFRYPPWWLKAKEGLRLIEIDEYRVTSKGLLVHIVGIDDRDVAKKLCQQDIVVKRSQFPGLEQGEYYWHQLEGLRVISRQGNVQLGVVTGILETGANDVLEVKGDSESLDRQERLIPYTEQFVLSINLDAREIEVDWDPGF
ncbi:MAG: ribosome maturation factor RimM [Porticoccus sp.]|nr:ribosome maturation factor RimM [Porticoccus sp.]